MTRFNPEKKKVLTVGECLQPAMEITSKWDAIQYLESYIKYIQHHLDTTTDHSETLTAIEIAKKNLGYFAGYYSNEIRERVETLFDCSHSYFGTIKDNRVPTAEEAFNMGLKRGKK